jgi:hypothetical protein
MAIKTYLSTGRQTKRDERDEKNGHIRRRQKVPINDSPRNTQMYSQVKGMFCKVRKVRGGAACAGGMQYKAASINGCWDDLLTSESCVGLERVVFIVLVYVISRRNF